MAAPQVVEGISNAMLDAVETFIGPSPVLKIRTGAKPANEAAADAGTVLATIQLPADWMGNAAGRTKAKSGTWDDNAADGSGDAAHFRIYNSAGVCMIQGTVGLTGSGAHLEVDNINFKVNQAFSITTFTMAMPNGA